MLSKLTFQRKFLPKYSGICSEDRNYIDIVIDNKRLSEILGGVSNNIGKFGWRNNTDFEMKEISELKKPDFAYHNNGLFSIYVCAECGDEGCLAVLFRKETTENNVIWSNFV